MGILKFGLERRGKSPRLIDKPFPIRFEFARATTYYVMAVLVDA